ncbi:YceD family protein [Carnimonas nigrificans]|uniref:YceD family protein n=1 Tax=Carnimonas nigrificans TaxID=64323 RepID=UPI00046F5C92|nr:YceD family protein [Carnimonas nigrificans]
MSITRIPHTVEPYRLAAAAEYLEGNVPLEKMPRLLEAVGEQQGECAVRLQFGVDEQAQRYIEGAIEAQVMMECQRCLQQLPVDISADFLLGLLAGDSQAAHLPKRYDPVIIENDQLDLWSIVEEELLLDLPQVAYHQEGECPVSKEQLQSGDEIETHNPFSVLNALKSKN